MKNTTSEKNIQNRAANRITSPIFYTGLSKALLIMLEDLAILLESGMDILSATKLIRDEQKTMRTRRMMDGIVEELETGETLAAALEKMHLLPMHILSLIRVGESSGRIVENLKLALEQHHKMQAFKSKTKSALVYPGIVLTLTLIVGIGTAWFILPMLTRSFVDLQVPLPLATQWLVVIGDFFAKYGLQVVPAFVIAILILMYVLFVWKRTRFIGMKLLFSLPIFRSMLRDNELTHFAYLMGGMLAAGLPILTALQAMEQATEMHRYKKLYRYLHDAFEAGLSFDQAFSEYRSLHTLVPTTAQHMIIAGERSGKLSETFIRVGTSYEEKAEGRIKSFTTLLEPVVIVIVGLIVFLVAFAIIMPIYSIIGGIS